MSTDFSRKCRDKVNISFKKLKIILSSFPRYSQCQEWSRFDILERAVEALELKRGISNSYTRRNNIDRTNLSNKELCQLYRTRLNNAFDALKCELDLLGEDLSGFRLFSRNGILQAACAILQGDQVKVATKRKREDSEESPNKIRLNDSGYQSPSISPTLSLQYAYLISYLKMQEGLKQQEQTQFWRPW